MKTLDIVTGAILSLFISTAAAADVELSSLVQWEESQIGQVEMVPTSDSEMINKINTMEATATGQSDMSSLIQWEESQYAQPYRLSSQSNDSIVAKINKMDATAAGQSKMSNLIQWEEAF